MIGVEPIAFSLQTKQSTVDFTSPNGFSQKEFIMSKLVLYLPFSYPPNIPEQINNNLIFLHKEQDSITIRKILLAFLV